MTRNKCSDILYTNSCSVFENLLKERVTIMKYDAVRKVFKMRAVLFSLMLCTALLGISLFSLHPLLAAADSNVKAVKVVNSVMIEEGDSLWSIAERYYTKDFKSMKNYIKEIKMTNHLSSDTIHAGNYLIVPYYEK